MYVLVNQYVIYIATNETIRRIKKIDDSDLLSLEPHLLWAETNCTMPYNYNNYYHQLFDECQYKIMHTIVN